VSTSSLVIGVLLGALGLGYFVYGRKQRAVVPLVCGLVLMVIPYFVSNAVLLVAVGAVLAAMPYLLRL
jgi:hypothetical protein